MFYTHTRNLLGHSPIFQSHNFRPSFFLFLQAVSYLCLQLHWELHWVQLWYLCTQVLSWLEFQQVSQGEFTLDCVIYWNVGMYVLLPIDHLFIKSARTIFFEQYETHVIIESFQKSSCHCILYNLKLLQNKKGQKDLRYPTKKQSFSLKKDCFFVGYLKFFCP